MGVVPDPSGSWWSAGLTLDLIKPSRPVRDQTVDLEQLGLCALVLKPPSNSPVSVSSVQVSLCLGLDKERDSPGPGGSESSTEPNSTVFDDQVTDHVTDIEMSS